MRTDLDAMNKIRVLEMIDRPFLGGGQITLLTLANGLDKERFEVAAAFMGEGPLGEELRKAGIPCFAVDLRKKAGPGAVAGIAGVLRKNAIDILHTHGGVAGLYGRLAARKAGIRAVVHTVHGIHYLHYRNPFLRTVFIVLERWLARMTDAIVFVSAADLDRGKRLRLASPAQARLIRNGVPETIGIPSDFDPLKKKAELGAEGRPLVVAVSRLHRQKGLIHLLHAAPLVRREIPDVQIVVAGGGPLENRLAAKGRMMRLGGNLLLLGERADAREILAAADVFVLPSLWEGLPYVLVEAAALGKAIVATDIDGVREVLRSGVTGILVPPKDAGSLAAAVVSLLEDKAFAGQLGARAQAEIPSRFSVPTMIKETERLYLEILKDKKAVKP
jgi:glycosyltransferase involved in cell wall biosynthesis